MAVSDDSSHPRWVHHLTSRTAVLWMVGITLLLVLEAGFLYWKNAELSRRVDTLQQSLPDPTPTLPALDSPAAGYSCPEDGWVDCSSGPAEGVRYYCTPEALTWFHKYCPGFQGMR